jgi:hypothetical protein
MQYTFNGVCKGTTKAGARCRRIVVYANGLCKAHGGDSMEYMRERALQIADKAKRRIERYKRRIEREIRTEKAKSDMRSAEQKGFTVSVQIITQGQ